MKAKLTLSLVALLLGACSTVGIYDYAGTGPELDLKTFFDGDLKAYGIVQDYNGKVTRRFRADIKASWKNDEGILDEVFWFDDGERSTRLWRLQDLGDGRYVGTAGDVVGQAAGQVRGSAFRWQYDLIIPFGDDELQVRLDDWLYLVTENRLLNRTSIRKFGIEVGEVTLVIENPAL